MTWTGAQHGHPPQEQKEDSMAIASGQPPQLDLVGLQESIAACGKADSGPYEPGSAGRPTVAEPSQLPSNSLGLSQVIQALAAADGDWTVDADRWPRLAVALVAIGGSWPAAAQIAAAEAQDEAGITAAVARLAKQTEVELGRLPRLHFWDTAVGLIARAWRLGVFGFGEDDAIALLNALWWEVHHDDALEGPGIVAIWTAMKIYELQEFDPMADEVVALISRAEQLVPPCSVNAPFCAAFVEAIHP
jgi:hypothetical protein